MASTQVIKMLLNNHFNSPSQDLTHQVNMSQTPPRYLKLNVFFFGYQRKREGVVTRLAKSFSRLKVVCFSSESNKEKSDLYTFVLYCLFSDMNFAVDNINAVRTE